MQMSSSHTSFHLRPKGRCPDTNAQLPHASVPVARANGDDDVYFLHHYNLATSKPASQ